MSARMIECQIESEPKSLTMQLKKPILIRLRNRLRVPVIVNLWREADGSIGMIISEKLPKTSDSQTNNLKKSMAKMLLAGAGELLTGEANRDERSIQAGT